MVKNSKCFLTVHMVKWGHANRLFWGNVKTKYISDTHSDTHIAVMTKFATHTWPNMSTMVGEKIWSLNIAHS